MRKLLPLFVCVFLCNINADAQYVSIPDSGFKYNLKFKYPGCFNALGQLDTTCSAIVNETTLLAGGWGGTGVPDQYYPVLNVEGLQYFKNLQSLTIGSDNTVTKVSYIPVSVKRLSVYFSQVDSLPALPPNLEYFSCELNEYLKSLPSLPAGIKNFILRGSNKISVLPPLPAALTNLECSGNFSNIQAFPAPLKRVQFYSDSITTLPPFPVPSSITYLACGGKNMLSLPALPGTLDSFICYSPVITALPILPSTLKFFDCSNNRSLKTIPNLPEGLLSFNCSNLQVNMQNQRYRSGVLENLPALPNSLTQFNCSGNLIKSLSQIPPNLPELFCGYNMLTALPSATTGVLKTLYCDSNLIEILPVLPKSVKYIQCFNNKLKTIEAFPDSLNTIDCSNNLLTTLPSFTINLSVVLCNNNKIASLPSLNNSLTQLGCAFNMLENLPALNTTALTSLRCNNNKLTQLPLFPSKLSNIFCQNNRLTKLPELLTSINYLDCSGNDIYCLPKLPNSVYSLTMDDKIKCLPNYPSSYNPNGQGSFFYLYLKDPLGNVSGWNWTYAICNPTNNVNGCNTFPTMQGVMFYDANSNGIKDAGEAAAVNKRITLSDSSYTFTDKNGEYFIIAGNTGNYSLTASAPVYYNAVPATHNFNFTTYDTTVTANFALQSNTTFDSLAVKITPLTFARPGFRFYYQITYENTGTTMLSPNIVFNYDSTRLVYDSSSSASIVHNGSTLSLSENNFPPMRQKSLIAYFKLKTTAVLGDTLFSTAALNANGKTFTGGSTTVIRGSYDPNDKEATLQLTPLQVASGKYINYTIRFQNTGTDTAFNIVIGDTLSDQLQWNTLEMLNTSHPCKTTVNGDKVYFEFLNILLPDSNVNEPASHGFVAFRIKPTPTVPVNSTIYNKASIFFDYNLPVVTNTAGTLIQNFNTVPLHLISFNAVPQNNNTTALYWNTDNEINTSFFVIEQSKDGIHFIPVGTVNAKGLQSNNYTSTVSDANAATIYYRIKITDNDGNYSYSPVVKIDKRKNSTGFSILTNPVKDFIVLNTNDRSLNNTSCNIISTQGVVVKNFTIKQGSQIVYVKDLPAGVYYVRTVNGSNKILIQ